MRYSILLVDELLIGNVPQLPVDLDLLEQEGVRAILSLCAAAEAVLPQAADGRFMTQRVVLPDHRCGRLTKNDQIDAALKALRELAVRGPVYLHCIAGIERSPLVAIAWLMRSRGLDFQTAFEYVQQVHPGSNPLPAHLAVLRRPRLFSIASPKVA